MHKNRPAGEYVAVAKGRTKRVPLRHDATNWINQRGGQGRIYNSGGGLVGFVISGYQHDVPCYVVTSDEPVKDGSVRPELLPSGPPREIELSQTLRTDSFEGVA